MENGTTTEIAISGSEGLVGIALFMGGETTPPATDQRRARQLQV